MSNVTNVLKLFGKVAGIALAIAILLVLAIGVVFAPVWMYILGTAEFELLVIILLTTIVWVSA